MRRDRRLEETTAVFNARNDRFMYSAAPPLVRRVCEEHGCPAAMHRLKRRTSLSHEQVAFFDAFLFKRSPWAPRSNGARPRDQ
jgi:hypothetical protein